MLLDLLLFLYIVFFLFVLLFAFRKCRELHGAECLSGAICELCRTSQKCNDISCDDESYDDKGEEKHQGSGESKEVVHKASNKGAEHTAQGIGKDAKECERRKYDKYAATGE